MRLSQTKAVLMWGAASSAAIFLALSYGFHMKVGKRTSEAQLDPQVAAGKWV